MYILKGFLSFPEFVNNAFGKIAPIGEISKDSLTYAKETGLHRHSLYTGVTLHSFLSQDSVLGYMEPPTFHSNLALELGKFVLDSAIDKKFTSDRSNVLQDLEVRFDGTLKNIEIGVMVHDGTHWVPEWISYQLESEEAFVRLWFSDASFSAQYDNYEYEFIPPIPNIDDFFQDRQRVVNLLAENNVKRIVSQIDQVRGEYPYTLLRTEEYKWESSDGGDSLRTDWTVMIYGRYGNDPDKIRLALIDWIVDNSSHSRNEWLALFPDVFTPTEFMVLPLWHRFAIPNQTIQGGIYSPTITLSDALDVAKELTNGIGYDNNHLMDNTTIAPTPLSGLSLVIVGSEANRNGVKNFAAHYPDYAGFPTSYRDFARLSNRTQEWTYFLLSMLSVAQEMTEFTVIPPSYSRIVRDGVVYAVKEFQGMEYLMATRLSTVKTLGYDAPYEPEFDEEVNWENTLSVEARMVREHLMYEENPHYTHKSNIGLGNVGNVKFLDVLDGRFNVESRLNAFYDFQGHMAENSNAAHEITAQQVGLDNVVNGRYLLSNSVRSMVDSQLEGVYYATTHFNQVLGHDFSKDTLGLGVVGNAHYLKGENVLMDIGKNIDDAINHEEHISTTMAHGESSTTLNLSQLGNVYYLTTDGAITMFDPQALDMAQ